MERSYKHLQHDWGVQRDKLIYMGEGKGHFQVTFFLLKPFFQAEKGGKSKRHRHNM